MTPNRITFADIQTSDLLYYDPDIKEICFHFCRERNIDCLPKLHDPSKFYQRTEDGFREEDVAEERRVYAQENIFGASLIDRFRTHPLLFVYTDHELTGVVHFSDYNRPSVDAYLFGLLSVYERALRKLLNIQGLNNQDMLAFFDSIAQTRKNEKTKSIYLGKIDDYRKNQARNEKLPVFESFYFQDLIGLARHRKIIEISPEASDLRNMVMHAHELVNLEDPNRDDMIYDFASFKRFFERVRVALQDYQKVNNKIAFSGYSGE